MAASMHRICYRRCILIGPACPQILRFSSISAWEDACEPCHHDIDSTKICGVGPGLPFANYLLEMGYPRSIGITSLLQKYFFAVLDSRKRMRHTRASKLNIFFLSVSCDLHSVGLVPCAIGGTDIDLWQEGSKLFNNTIQRATAALAASPNSRFAGVLWYQVCNGDLSSFLALLQNSALRLSRVMVTGRIRC